MRWVLTWAAALAVLGWAAAILMAFTYQLAAEQSLTRAAAAGLREANCQRATSHTVEQSVRRRLAESGPWGSQVSIALERNGRPISGVIRLAADDRLSVSLSIPVDFVLPAWLHNIDLRGRNGTMIVWAEHLATGI